MNMIMEASSTYQHTLQSGRTQGDRKLLLRVGTKKYGSPNPANAAALQKIADVEVLEQLAEKLLDAGSWDELLTRV